MLETVRNPKISETNKPFIQTHEDENRMMYFLPDNVKTEAPLKSGQQLIQDPENGKGAMQKGDSFCINGIICGWHTKPQNA